MHANRHRSGRLAAAGRRIGRWLPGSWLLAMLLRAQEAPSAAPGASADPPATMAVATPPGPAAGSNSSAFLWHIEVKRQFTERGTPEESSRTTLRLEATPDAMISLIRLDLPFIDEVNGDPTTGDLGDIKFKFGLRAIPWGATRVEPFLEQTFPTANPESVGSGKYQLGLGSSIVVPIYQGPGPSADGPPRWGVDFKPELKQVFSYAGDPDATDINYTRLELALRGNWRRRVGLKINPKLVVDWQADGATGAVIELEPSWNINRRWSAELTLGQGLWGESLPGNYGRKVELSIRFNF